MPKKEVEKYKETTIVIVPVYVSYIEKIDILAETLSLLRKTNWGDNRYEIIVIDDNSPIKWYDKFFEDKFEPNLLDSIMDIHFSPENFGFPTTVNVGLTLAYLYSPKYICVLNDDVFVRENWLKTLCEELTEEMIFISPAVHSIIDRCVFDRSYRHPNSCCVVGKSFHWKFYNGYITEFGRGFFEDTDLLARVEKDGFEWKNTNRVLLHHKGGSSFNNLKNRKDIFLEAKKRFIEKWNFDPIKEYYPHLSLPGRIKHTKIHIKE